MNLNVDFNYRRQPGSDMNSVLPLLEWSAQCTHSEMKLTKLLIGFRKLDLRYVHLKHASFNIFDFNIFYYFPTHISNGEENHDLCCVCFSKFCQNSILYYSTSYSVSLLSHTDTIMYISCTIQLYYTDSLVV